MPNLELISAHTGLAEGVALDVMGPADLSVGVGLILRFTGVSPMSGRVVEIGDSGTRSVIEVEGERWWLHRRNMAVNEGQATVHPWTAGGRVGTA